MHIVSLNLPTQTNTSNIYFSNPIFHMIHLRQINRFVGKQNIHSQTFILIEYKQEFQKDLGWQHYAEISSSAQNLLKQFQQSIRSQSLPYIHPDYQSRKEELVERCSKKYKERMNLPQHKYKVQKIVGKAKLSNISYVLVKWKDIPNSQASWVPTYKGYKCFQKDMKIFSDATKYVKMPFVYQGFQNNYATLERGEYQSNGFNDESLSPIPLKSIGKKQALKIKQIGKTFQNHLKNTRSQKINQKRNDITCEQSNQQQQSFLDEQDSLGEQQNLQKKQSGPTINKQSLESNIMKNFKSQKINKNTNQKVEITIDDDEFQENKFVILQKTYQSSNQTKNPLNLTKNPTNQTKQSAYSINLKPHINDQEMATNIFKQLIDQKVKQKKLSLNFTKNQNNKVLEKSQKSIKSHSLQHRSKTAVNQVKLQAETSGQLISNSFSKTNNNKLREKFDSNNNSSFKQMQVQELSSTPKSPPIEFYDVQFLIQQEDPTPYKIQSIKIVLQCEDVPGSNSANELQNLYRVIIEQKEPMSKQIRMRGQKVKKQTRFLLTSQMMEEYPKFFVQYLENQVKILSNNKPQQ